MDTAMRTAQLSYAKRLQVGAVAVRDRRIICVGFNGTPPGHSNICEDDNNVTLPTVIHAEDNLVRFANENGIDIKNCTLYVTHSPCENCASIIKDAGFSEVVYLEAYRSVMGIILLENNNIKVRKYHASSNLVEG